MAKAQGIIGNFKGKVGNMVGYQLTDSNNKQTQGIRIYQPNVKNPKTSAQAEQRAKLAPINATYRALKMVIDRGNEGLPYGNKSRLAWLKQAFKAEQMPWFEKGNSVGNPVGCLLTKGSLFSMSYVAQEDGLVIFCNGVTSETTLNTVGSLSAALKTGYPSLKDGDQVTFILVGEDGGVLGTDITSIIIDVTNNDPISGFNPGSGQISIDGYLFMGAGSVIISREGDNGEHLRSTSRLNIAASILEGAPYDATSKTAAIESYMASGAANTDWAEESIQ